MKKLAMLIAAVIMVTVIMPLKSYAVTFTPGFKVESEAAYLVNLDKDIVVYEKNSLKKMYPASLTKIMTAIIVLDNVKDLDNTYFEAPLVVFDDLYGQGASAVGYSRGEVASVTDLMYSMMMYSACESAGILAYHVGGESIPNFIDMMNQKAQELGCTGTNFTNPHGLYDDDQYTNARDMAIITQYAIDNYPKFMEFACTTEYTMKATNYQQEGWATIYHTNKMLSSSSEYYYQYARGIKTGTLDESGRNLITSARKDGNNYLLVTLGGPMYDDEGNAVFDHFIDHKNIYEWAFNTFEFKTVLSSTQEITEVPVKYGEEKDYVILVPSGEYATLWPNTLDVSTLKADILTEGFLDENGQIMAPVKKGQKLGTYSLSLSGEVLCTVDLVANQDITLSETQYNLDKAKAFLGSFWFKLAIGIAIVLIILYIVIYIKINSKKKRRMKRVRNKRKF